MTSLPNHVGVFGGGRMGAGIAHTFLAAGAQVTVIEADVAGVQAAVERVTRSLTTAEQKGGLAEGLAAALDRLEVSDDATALGGCELIIEAVPENVDLKAGILAKVEALAPRAVLGTNTSSLSISGLAACLNGPERLIGLHFFNPVPTSDLVEIVVGSATAPEVVALAQNLVPAIGKTPITVQDSPGFASSRLGVAIALEAMRMVEEGVASAQDIDTAMTLGYRHPTGPLKTTDIVGLDVRLAIADHLAETLSPRFEPPQILRDKVAAGELGRKTGQGFYTW
ncbi:3-hydroxyacyl-CoA dehydrogenase family protein [Marmoricola sp. RAF53]|uniref:3-hydroxyacyl-CoA dehydrogenase family protein n=1 Tax=Marmoricola sp. RAF53 TaxID=3233059 RepID=UPI003F9DFD8A